MIHKKRKSIHVFESLARLAYNKGTALFRGNDPLRRSAATTFSLIIKKSSQTHLTCSTRLRQEWRQKHGKATHEQCMPTDEHINQEGACVAEARFVLLAYTVTESYMLLESHYYC